MMKRGLYLILSLVCLFCTSTEVRGDSEESIIPSIESMTFLNCEVQKIDRDSEAYKQHHSHHLSDFNLSQESVIKQTSFSTNWSGYAAATNLSNPAIGSVNRVYGVWAVPTLSWTNTNAYSSIWVGIDGYSSPTVEQIGTAHEWINGHQQNYAWFEMYPWDMFMIPGFPVVNGDLIGALVQYQGNNAFLLQIYNYTRGFYTTVPVAYTTMTGTQRSSAEWIVEAPSSNSGVLPLANFNFVPCGDCYATINNVFGPIYNNANWQSTPIFMQSGQTRKATPYGYSPTSFYVTWQHQ